MDVNVSLASLDDRLRDRVLAATGSAEIRAIRPAGDGVVVDALTGDRVVHMALELRPDGSVAEATESFRRQDVRGVRPAEEGDRVVDFTDGAREVSVPVACLVADRLGWPGGADETGPADDFPRLVASLDPPMCVVTVAADQVRAGCLVAFVAQASIHPPRMIVCLSDKSRTTEVAAGATHLAVHFLSENNLELARLFGEETGDDTDKFAGCIWHTGPAGVPIIDGTLGWAVLRVLERSRGGDHLVHLGEVEAARKERDERALGFQQVRGFHAGHCP